VRPPQAMVTIVIERVERVKRVERVERVERRREMGYRVPKRFRSQVGCRS
jgi:hypothetical protein